MSDAASKDSDTKIRVAIIGGGIAGLTAYRHAAAYPSIRATIFESSSSLGGLWSRDHPYHRPDLSTNVSRHTVGFSDFTWSQEQIEKDGKSLFPYAGDVGDHLHRYAERYVRSRDIRLRARVEGLRFEDKEWIVTISSTGHDSRQVQEEQHFDHVILTSGVFTVPYTPSIPGAVESGIPLIHSANFLAPKTYEGRVIAVIGSSLSGVEVAGMLTPYAAEIHHIHTHPFYPLGRHLSNGEVGGKGKVTFLPSDIVFNRRSTRESIEERTQPTAEMNRNMHSFLSSICPSLPCPSDLDEPARVGISDTYLAGLRSGVIQSHLAKLESIDPETSTLRLSSGEKIAPVDAIIFGTGYTTSLPYLPLSMKEAIEYDGNNRAVPFLSHRLVLHPDLPQASFVGLYRGPYFAISEMQAQYLAALIAGEKEWPSEEEMRAGVERERQIREFARDGKCQYPHDDYGGLVETYARFLGRTPPTLQPEVDPALADQILPVNYPRERTEDVQMLENDILESLRLSKSGTWVLGAAFRSWGGRWRVTRAIKHDSPEAVDGTFEGIATFRLRPPSSLPPGSAQVQADASDSERGVLEYIYYETGTFTTADGVSSQARKKFVYRYYPFSDSISVWFVEDRAPESDLGVGKLDSWFHDITLEDSDDFDIDERFRDHQAQGGWTARGNEHEQCRPIYKFPFEGGELQQFGIRYEVREPENGHVSEAWYERE